MEFDISLEEFQQILDSKNSLEKSPPWFEKFKKWVRAHTGNSQILVDGQPTCFGNGGCGPCPGICFGSSIVDGGDNGDPVSDKEFILGLRAIAFSIFENQSNANKRKMVIQIPSEYADDFIMNNLFEVESDEFLPMFYVSESGFNSITVEEGRYPVIVSANDGMTRTIVNITVE